MLNYEILGGRLKALRTAKKQPQTALAELLQVTTTQISDLENGKTGTTLERLSSLADYFDVSTDYLLGRTDNPEINR